MVPPSVLVGMLTAVFCFLLGHVDGLTESSGCGKELPKGIRQGHTGSSNELSITSSGLNRTYLLHVPTVYTPTNAHGLIFSFHGRGQSGAEQERLSQFSEQVFNPSMLVAYPDGINQGWQSDPDATTNDVQLTLDLITNLTSTYCIDEDKIFAAGKSNGGGFAANILACDPTASKKIAAFAGIAGAYYAKGQSDVGCDGTTVPVTCSPGRTPVPIFETHGSADPVIPYDGGARRGACLPSIPHFMNAWAERNGLGTGNVSTSLYNGNVEEYQWGKSDNFQGINTHYWINGLGHAWPSTVPNDDGSGTYFNATPLIMDFFSKWTLTNTPDSVSSASTQSVISSSSTASKTLATPTSSSTTSAPTIICPAANSSTVTIAGGDTYKIFCGFDTTSPYFGSPLYALGSFGNCISKCAETDACQHVTYDGTCYLKKSVTGWIYTGNKVNRVAVLET